MTDYYDSSFLEVILDGVAFPLQRPLQDNNLRTFQSRITIGDPSKDSNPLLSSWVISDLSGGHGVDDMAENLDVARYWYGTLYTRYPGQITKSYAVRDYLTSVNDGINARFAGDINVSGTWQPFHTLLIGANWTLSSSPTGNDTITGEPVNQCVVYRGQHANDCLLIPMGANGFAVVDPVAATTTNHAADATHPAMQAVTVWDNKCVALDTDGVLWWTVDPTGAWTQYASTATLPRSSVAMNLVPYFDRQGNPTLFAITDTDLWQYNLDIPEVFTVGVSFPPHPYHGLAACTWGGDLYFSVGMGVHRYAGGSLMAMGLDRDHGLPAEYTGYIVQGGLVAGYNGMYAFVAAPDLSNDTWPDGEPDPVPSIHEWTGSGWHQIWQGEVGDQLVPYSMAISRSELTADQTHCLVWGIENATANTAYIKQMMLPVTFANPRQRARKEGGFQSGGFLYTGRFDAGMKGYIKIANALDLTIPAIPSGSDLSVYYQLNGEIDAPETLLGTISAAGDHSLPFGTVDTVFGTSIYPGVPFEHIRLKFILDDATDDAFIMESAVLSFLKTLPPANTWTAYIDCTKEGPGGYGPEDMMAKIKALHEADTWTHMIYRRRVYRVSITGNTGTKQGGTDERGIRVVTILEIPQSLGAA